MAEAAFRSQMIEEDLEATNLRAFSKPLAKGGSAMTSFLHTSSNAIRT